MRSTIRNGALVAGLTLLAAPMMAAENPTLISDPAVLESMGMPAGETVYRLANQTPFVPEDFGGSDNHTSIAAKAFIPRQDTTGTQALYNGGASGCCANLSRTGGTEEFWDAPIDLPSGALLKGFTLYAVDSNATLNLDFFTFEVCSPVGGGTTTTTTLTSGGTTGGTGGQAVTVDLTAPITVNNTNCHYTARVAFRDITGLTLQRVRVRWSRQVSPAPAVATFNDVPTTHPQFRFVEALVAAGVTGGCGAGLYCPDSPLTRGQMAVFLSVALGLRFQ
jgi:hypothetical protein